VLGLKYKLVRGYKGSSINIAMERGEIHAQIVGWDSIKAQRPEWIRDKLITIIGTSALKIRRTCVRSPGSPISRGPDPIVRRCVWSWRVRPTGGYVLPPGVPVARAALRRARCDHAGPRVHCAGGGDEGRRRPDDRCRPYRQLVGAGASHNTGLMWSAGRKIMAMPMSLAAAEIIVRRLRR
jgi:hypothetical protein